MSASEGTVSEGRTIPAGEVRVGDVLRSTDGTEFTVSRIEPFIFPGMLAFVEDTDAKWFKMPCPEDGEVTVLSRD
jgi:hypothetical protein